MTTTHIPGPWKITEGQWHVAHRAWFIDAGKDGKTCICKVYGQDIERKANARLIAKAPTMRDEGFKLAMAVLQSDLYQQRPDVRESVDRWLAIIAEIDGKCLTNKS